MGQPEKEKSVLELFHAKASLKQDVYEQTLLAFNELKVVLNGLVEEYSSNHEQKDKRVKIAYKEIGKHEARLQFGGDLLIFHMHSNIFSFEPSHSVMKSSYVKADPTRAYCGVINVYNFLNDSFKYNRSRDLGLLIARLFINKENHFFVEGKKKLNFMYRDFMHDNLTRVSLGLLLDQMIRYAIDFELQSPSFQKVEVVSVDQMKQLSDRNKLQTVKRMGFRMSWEQDDLH